MSYDPAPFAARRMKLARQIRAAGGGVVVIPTAPERTRNRDSDYPYRHDSYFFYLTGFTEPEAALVMCVSEQETRSLLFCRPKHAEREIWDGFRYGPEAACEFLGLDEAHPNETLGERLPELFTNQPALWFGLGYEASWDSRVFEALNAVRGQTRCGISAPTDIRDVRVLLDEMRVFKDPHEIATMRRAADISAAAFRRAMCATRPGCFEYEVEAELLYEFRRSGSPSPAYPSIVASGANACVLHYVGNDRQTQNGDLLLIDAGCELDGYAADISRTFPVNGRFEGAQRDIYALVLSMQKAALAECRIGNDFNAPHEAAIRTLTRGLIDLGVLAGDLDAAIENGAYRRFYMHRTSHWLGLDVHDAGEYKRNGVWRPLEAGMVLTIEPGCYIRAEEDIPPAFRNIGVRIEDDVLITTDGPDILTAAAPKCISDIEACMAGREA